MIVSCSTKKLHEFFDKINQIHPSIKLTMTHTSRKAEPISERCSCEETSSIQFLDTSCSIVNKRIKVDLFRKKTDRNQYLLTSSCHPVQTTKKHSIFTRVTYSKDLYRTHRKRPKIGRAQRNAFIQKLYY